MFIIIFSLIFVEGSEDLKRKMYSSILLVGGGLKFKGMSSWLEKRLAQHIPIPIKGCKYVLYNLIMHILVGGIKYNIFIKILIIFMVLYKFQLMDLLGRAN